MVQLGVSFEGFPHLPFKKLSNGHIIPDASVTELQQRHRASLRNQIDAAIEAESVGYEYVVHSEHHSHLLGAVSPNPILTHTAIARETEDVRLLQMANILPWHEPVRLAEQIAMLDVLSDGRVDVGVGRGGPDPAAVTLGQYWGGTTSDPAKNYHSFEEKYEILVEAWTTDFLSHRGQFHAVPPTYASDAKDNDYLYFADEVCEHDPGEFLSVSDGTTRQTSLPVVPQPQQSPHPQLWKPAMSPDAAKWAAERGMNICMHMSDPSTVREIADAYYDAAEAADWPDRRPEYDGRPFERGWDAGRGRGIGIIAPIINTDVADEETLRRWRLTLEYVLARDEEIEFTDGLPEVQPADVDVDEFIDSGSVPIYGDSDEIADQIVRFARACEFDDLFMIADPNYIGLTHEERRAQLRVIATEVRPRIEAAGLTREKR